MKKVSSRLVIPPLSEVCCCENEIMDGLKISLSSDISVNSHLSEEELTNCYDQQADYEERESVILAEEAKGIQHEQRDENKLFVDIYCGATETVISIESDGIAVDEQAIHDGEPNDNTNCSEKNQEEHTSSQFPKR